MKRRVMALVLAVSMVLGNTATAWAAESSAPFVADEGVITTSGDEGLETTSDNQTSYDENGEGTSQTTDSEAKQNESGTLNSGDASDIGSGTAGTTTENNTEGSSGGESVKTDTDSNTPADEGSKATDADGNIEGSDGEVSVGVPEKEESDEEENTDAGEADSVSDNELSTLMNTLAGQNYLSDGSVGAVTVTYNGSDTSQNFSTLAEAKMYIEGEGEYANQGLGVDSHYYTITLNSKGGEDTDNYHYASENDLNFSRVATPGMGVELNLNGQSLRFTGDTDNVVVCLRRIYNNVSGSGSSDASSYYDTWQSIGYGAEAVKFIPQSEEGLSIEVFPREVPNVVFGDSEDIENSKVVIKEDSLPDTEQLRMNVTIYGDFECDEKLDLLGTVTVHNVQTKEVSQEAVFKKGLQVDNLDLTNGDIRTVCDEDTIVGLWVSKTMTAGTGHQLVAEPGTSITVKDIKVVSTLEENRDSITTNDEADDEPFGICLYEGINSESGSESGEATITINGKIASEKTVLLPVSFSKYNQTKSNDTYNQEEIAFDDAEIIATVSTTFANTNSVNLWTENSWCVVKEGTALVTDEAEVRVIYSGENDKSATRYYRTFEEAAKNLSIDFCGYTGNYNFYFLKSVTELKNDVTLPNCVTNAYFGTEEKEEGRFIQRQLDLNGKTLTISHGLSLCEGLRVVSKDGDDNSGNAAAPGKLSVKGQLYIDESAALVKEDTGEDGDSKPRPAVLDNVNILGSAAEITLRSKDEKDTEADGQENTINGTITAKNLNVSEGSWKVGEVTTGILFVNGNTASSLEKEGGLTEEYQTEQARLNTSKITINNGRADINGVLGSYLEEASGEAAEDIQNPLNINTLVLTLNKAKLYIGKNTVDGKSVDGQVYATEINVTSAYPQESVNDWTIENSGLLCANTINIKAGAFQNNSGGVIADTVNLVNLENGYDSSFIVNTITQTSAGKTWLCDNSKMMVNVSGTLNNITLGDRNGNSGRPYLGRSQAAVLMLGGTFTVNEENQQLYFMVSDEYKEIKSLVAAATRIDVGCTKVRLNENDIVFYISSDKAVFPVDNITVLSNGSDTDKENSLSFVYQSGKEIKLTSKYIQLYAATPGVNSASENEDHIKSFTTWKECITYLTAIGNTNTTYVIDLNTAKVDVGGALTLPKNVGELKIRGADNGTDGDAARVTEFITTGITLTTNTTFENIKLGDGTAINTGGKEVTFDHVTGNFAKMTGTSATIINVADSQITVSSALTGINRVNVDNSTLTVQGNFTVNTLELDGGTLDVNGEKTITTVSKELILKHKESSSDGDSGKVYERKNPSIDAAGTIKLANITIYTDGASIKYNNAKAPGLTITGSITSMQENGSNVASEDVYVVKNTGGNDGLTYKVVVEKPEDTDYKIIKKNSISLSATIGGEAEGIVEGTSLVNAAQIAASWFVVDKKIASAEDGSTTTLAQLTYKEGVVIKCAGSVEILNFVLMQIDSGDTSMLEADAGQIQKFKDSAVHLGGFKTLQEAFAEIDRLNKVDNEYYILLKEDAKNTVKNAAADYAFPSKAAYVLIEGENEETELIYKADITVKTNTYFDNLVLTPTVASGKLNLGNFEVVLSDTKFADDTEKKITVTGGGLTKGSQLKLHNLGRADFTEMSFAAISNIGTLWQSGVDVIVIGTATMNTLRMENTDGVINETFTGLSTISVKDIITIGGNTLQTLPAYTLNKDTTQSIKAITPRLTISGRVEIIDYIDNQDVLNIELLLDAVTKKTMNLTDQDTYDRVSAVLEASGLSLAKAINVDSTYVDFSRSAGGGEVYKKAGVLVYRDKEAFACLEYNVIEGDDSTKVVTYFETFADAVKEINNLRTRRAYTIMFLGGEDLEDITLETLTMPNKNYISHLTLTSDGNEVYYKGNITFTSDVTLDNIVFVQAVVANKENKRAEDAAAEGLPAPVTINTGGFNLDFAEGEEGDGGDLIPNVVDFNTPVILNGGGKGTLILHENVELTAGVYLAAEISDVILEGENRLREDYSASQLRGKITNFATVNIDQSVDLLGWPTLNAKTKEQVYNATELNVTALNISDYNWMEVGNDFYADKITVKELTLTGAELCVTGSGTFTNVTLAGDGPVLSVTSPEPILDDTQNPPTLPVCYFAVLGTLTNTSYGATLETGLNAKAESALNISGTVVPAGSYLENIDEKITIKVSVPLDILPDSYMEGSSIKLGETEISIMQNRKEVTKTVASTLLTAKNADERAFLADGSCVDDLDIYEDSAEGYILKKTGSVISVYYGDQIGVALYREEEAGSEGEEAAEIQTVLYNYYPTLADAIAAIEALKDKGVKYKIELLQDVYKAKSEEGKVTPVSLTMPVNAAHITITSNTDSGEKEIHLASNLILKCPTTLENVKVVTTKGIQTKGFALTIRNLKDMMYGNIDGGKKGSITIENDTSATTYFKGTMTNVNELILKKATVSIGGNATVTTLRLEGEACFVVGGTPVVTDIYNDGTEQNEIQYFYNKPLQIKGRVYTTNIEKLELQMNNTVYGQAVSAEIKGLSASNGRVELEKANKLVTMSNEALSEFEFYIGKGEQKQEGEVWSLVETNEQVTDRVVWAKGNVYLLDEDYAQGENDTVKVEWKEENSAEAEGANTQTTLCLDFAQAAAYINGRGDKAEDYTITFENDIQDPAVTDAAISVLTLPAKDKAAGITIDGVNGKKFGFAGDITANGKVIFTNLAFNNSKDFKITNKKNSDGTAAVHLANVSYAETIAEETKVGIISTITGDANTTEVYLSGKPLEIGGLTNIHYLELKEILTSRSKAIIKELHLTEKGAWKAFGVTTIGQIEVGLPTQEDNVGEGIYLATWYPKDSKGNLTGIPQLTISGEVDGKLPVKVYDITTGKELGHKDGDEDSEAIKKAYNGAKLLAATTASADRFIAHPYAEYNKAEGTYQIKSDLGGDYQAFKDGKNYVYNGDISGMEVKLMSDNGSEVTYVKTYAEAIQVINNSSIAREYTMELQRTSDSGDKAGNKGIILTGVNKWGDPAEAALTMPKQGKAYSLTIVGEDEGIELKFTGKITPTSDLRFKQLIMTETTMDSKTREYQDLGYIDLNVTGTYEVQFGDASGETDDVKTKNASGKSAEMEADSFYQLAESGEYDLIFKSISAPKGKIILANKAENEVYCMGDIRVYELNQKADSVVAAKGKVTLGTWLCEDKDAGEEALLKTENAIAIEVIEGKGGRFAIDTCYTKKTWGSALSQLTVTDISGLDNVLKLNFYTYDTKGYEKVSEAQLESLLITAEEKPATWKKLFTASKMSLMAKEDSNSGEIVITGAEDYNLTKYEGGVYLTEEENSIEVVGTKPVSREAQEEPDTEIIYEAAFLSWEQAVKEIDRQNKLLDYTITVLNTQEEYTLIKTVTMPSKANSLLIKGEAETNDNSITGLVTTTGTITLKCKTTFENIHLAAVKKSGNGYYTSPMTLNVGNYHLDLVDVPDGNDYEGLGYFETQIALTGAAKGTACVDPLYDGKGNIHGNGITQITKLGNVTLDNAGDIEKQEDEQNADGRTVYETYYNIKNGISGVNILKIEEGVYVDCDTKEVSVKDLRIGHEVAHVLDAGKEDVYPDNYSFPNNPNWSSLKAKNITISGTATMASAQLKAGTTTVGDGKIALTDVVFNDMHNHIEGKQDKSGNSLIQIKGSIKAGTKSAVPSWSASTISLTVNNSGITHVKLAEGMSFLTAPKAENSWFRPYYSSDEGANMGRAISVIIEKALEDSGQEDVYDDLYGLYKSGNYIKFGKIKGIEDTNDDETKNLYDIAEAHVFSHSTSADDTYDKHPFTTYMTFEEAVNGINSMALQKDVEGANGKVAKTNADYTIEVLRDVEIGNTKGDGKYTPMTLPTKVSELTIFGYGSSIFFSGNITLRSNTRLESGIVFTPMKVVKGGAEPTTTNIAAGNFKLTFAGVDVADGDNMFDENGGYISLLNNLTGGAKGELIIVPHSGIEAVNVTGFNKVRFTGNGKSSSYDDGGQSKMIYQTLKVNGKMNVKSIIAEDYAVATLMNGQGLTANVIGQDKNSELTIHNPAEVPMRLNGGKLSEVGSSTTETGSAYSGSGSPINLKMVSSSGTVLDGTKMITGKYLKKSDWKVDVLAAEWDTETARNIYANGNDLYLGSEYIQ